MIDIGDNKNQANDEGILMIKRFLFYLFLCSITFSLCASSSLGTFVMAETDLQQVISELDRASFNKDVHKVEEIYNAVGHQAFICIASSLYWSSGNSLLHKAAYDDAVDIVYLLLWLGIDPNLLNIWHETPLMYSIHWGNMQMVRLFLQKNVDLTIKNFQNKTAFHIAMQYEHPAIGWVLYKNSYEY